ncbi:MAG: tRNA (adenosine(37)-N6)-threonylcarbamoyltransferase complex dimerization subunit type 1 TsaB [Bacteroidetes bacterium]|nr:tRNA (adenosine(37)-N6)-threonylcarbamoyltransferase complex dimerization subunit type 1 TsaB [Bacteroidota bacterium]MCH8523705.1 tRNA (adenosine(37)-N6)-threonylcarbamoyltransferase complex dimerization subunit type 1 TsaB [Balneolales bacterium]
MNTLAVDTSTSICSVALHMSGKMYARQQIISGKHSSVLFGQIQSVLQDAGTDLTHLDAVIYAAGPGSYTGLRVGGSALKGLLFPHPQLAFYAASTLAGFACCVPHDEAKITVHSVIDARRQHAYYQCFTIGNGHVEACGEPAIEPLTTIQTFLNPGDHIIGTGLARFNETVLLGLNQHPETAISAEGLLKLFMSDTSQKYIRKVNPASFEPDYMSGNTWNHAR